MPLSPLALILLVVVAVGLILLMTNKGRMRRDDFDHSKVGCQTYSKCADPNKPGPCCFPPGDDLVSHHVIRKGDSLPPPVFSPCPNNTCGTGNLTGCWNGPCSSNNTCSYGPPDCIAIG